MGWQEADCHDEKRDVKSEPVVSGKHQVAGCVMTIGTYCHSSTIVIVKQQIMNGSVRPHLLYTLQNLPLPSLPFPHMLSR